MRILTKKGSPLKLCDDPYPSKTPDTAELPALAAIDPMNEMLCVLPSADGCGEEKFVNSRSAGRTKVVVTVKRNCMRITSAQTAIPVLPAGGGVLEGMTATYGMAKYAKGKPSTKIRNIFIASRCLETRGYTRS